MPKSRVRKKVKEKKTQIAVDPLLLEESEELESPRWLAPVMVSLFVMGLLWIVVFYISSTAYPIPGIGAWNMLVGFGFIGIGFSLATRWQ